MTSSIAKRSITSITWNISSHIVHILMGFIRSWLLARWLPVYVFGIYSFAQSIQSLSGMLANFGMGGAFVHRAPETEDEDQTAAVHFTLKLIFTLLWAILMTVGAFLFAEGEARVALLVITATATGMHLIQTPKMILIRRVTHRRLALLEFIVAVLTALVAIGLAWRGATLWALLAIDIVTLALNIVFLYVWQPVWRPRLAWSPPVMRYFLGFGSRNVISNVLLRALDRVDDLWAGIYLGQVALGFYSRAYTFATYPRMVLSEPVSLVVGGTYAELKGDRRRLSQAFVFTNTLLLRGGFSLAGLLVLVAPEFIRLVLGEKWLPMLTAFRLMLVFTLLDPIKSTVADLFIAVGKPDQVARIRFVQLAVLLVALFLLGPPLGIAGVALAVDLMLIVGMFTLFWQARIYVDFSPIQLFGVPGLALSLGILLSTITIILFKIQGTDWYTGFVKGVVFSIIYGIVLFLLERHKLFEVLSALFQGLPIGVKRKFVKFSLDKD